MDSSRNMAVAAGSDSCVEAGHNMGLVVGPMEELDPSRSLTDQNLDLNLQTLRKDALLARICWISGRPGHIERTK